MQIALRQSETARDRDETGGDSTHTCNNYLDRSSNNICITIGTFDKHEQTDSGRADMSDRCAHASHYGLKWRTQEIDRSKS